MNYSSYLARCIKSGVNTHLDRCKYPDVDIEEGLEKDHPSQVIRNCKVMVAARYIILAGCIIHEDFVTTPAADSEDGRRGIEKWQLWAHKFKEIADKGDVSAEVKLIRRCFSCSQTCSTCLREGRNRFLDGLVTLVSRYLVCWIFLSISL